MVLITSFSVLLCSLSWPLSPDLQLPLFIWLLSKMLRSSSDSFVSLVFGTGPGPEEASGKAFWWYRTDSSGICRSKFPQTCRCLGWPQHPCDFGMARSSLPASSSHPRWWCGENKVISVGLRFSGIPGSVFTLQAWLNLGKRMISDCQLHGRTS